MSKTRKRDRDGTDEILICCHAAWNADRDGYFKVPEDVYLYVYAPHGAALTVPIPRAIAAGEKIKEGDLCYRRMSCISLFNYNYEDTGDRSGDYTPHVLQNYPQLFVPGEVLPDYRVAAPGKDALESKDGSGIIVENIDVAEGKTLKLSELLCREQFRDKICHFGGCSWVSSQSNRRDIVIFKDEAMNDKYTVKLTEEEKRQKRAERFGKK